ncbi:GerMN domain-containing protein [Selenihalanaerobacter shriftii]|uniref:Sporulation and spore germination n=1 Tax=Selenihalanaerobacter shriftii TaxID=142842 RepID=A0A1T4QQD5_9FIRM|nr:GerMN domain-containing protein [Selenihalanaerobacter shriftii]SKA05989.1 Sporulation and spore germination [Selenihalanaerobacter shriftii]
MTKKNKKINYLFIGGVVLILGLLYLIMFTPSKIETKKVKLYFSFNQGQNLKAEVRKVTTDKLYKNTVQELINGPTNEELVRTIPDGTQLIDLKLKERTLVLNFNSKLKENHWGGSTGEMMTIYSIVNTMTQFPEINQVLFLIEGEEVKSLAGHMGLVEPISANEKIIIE